MATNTVTESKSNQINNVVDAGLYVRMLMPNVVLIIEFSIIITFTTGAVNLSPFVGVDLKPVLYTISFPRE